MKKTKTILERVVSVATAIRELGEKDEDVVMYKKVLSLFGKTSHLVNYQLAIVLTKAINEGWVPNWSDYNEWKYVLYFEMGGSRGFRFGVCGVRASYSGVGSRLCFKDEARGRHIVGLFPEVFERFMTIKK